MKFMKKIWFGQNRESPKKMFDSAFAQYSSFQAEATFYELHKNEKSLIFEESVVSFGQEQSDELSYYILVSNKNQERGNEQNQEDEYFVPLKKGMQVYKYMLKADGESAVGFQWKFEDSWLQLQFYDTLDSELFQ